MGRKKQETTGSLNRWEAQFQGSMVSLKETEDDKDDEDEKSDEEDEVKSCDCDPSGQKTKDNTIRYNKTTLRSQIVYLKSQQKSANVSSFDTWDNLLKFNTTNI